MSTLHLSNPTEFFNKLYDNFFCLRCTPQLFYYPFSNPDGEVRKGKITPCAMGSGILIKTDTRFFLVTTKHTFNNCNVSDIVILLKNNRAVQLPNNLESFNTARKIDNIDLIVFEFSIEIANELRVEFSFLPYRTLPTSHDLNEKNVYMQVGYVNKQTKIQKQKIISPPFGYLGTFRTIKKLDKIGFTNSDNITIDYSRRQQILLGKFTRSIAVNDIKGLSGGGIWYCESSTLGEKLIKLSLIGIMIEDWSDRGLIIGTKIKWVREIFRRFGID